MYHISAVIWPTFLQLGCITNFDMLFLVTGFISLVDELKCMLISRTSFLHKFFVTSEHHTAFVFLSVALSHSCQADKIQCSIV